MRVRWNLIFFHLTFKDMVAHIERAGVVFYEKTEAAERRQTT